MSGGEGEQPAAAPQSAQVSEPPARSRGEKIFLAALISCSLLAAIIFVALTAWGIFIPAMGTAILTATGIATLVYAFLGGKGGDSFSVRGMQLAGAAAVFAVVVYIVNGQLDAQIDKLEARRSTQANPAELLAAKARATRAEEERDQAVQALRRSGQSGERDVAAAVRAANADTELGKAVLAMWVAREGPFARTVGDEDVTARFNGRVADGSFEYCHAAWPRFKDRVIRFRLRDAESAGDITLTPGADIGPVCTRTRMNYSVRLGCDAARALIPDLVAGCTPQGGVAWLEGANRGEFNLFAIIENPITR